MLGEYEASLCQQTCGQGQTFRQQSSINLESPYQLASMSDLDESMGTERWSWPSSASVLSLASYWRVNTSGQDSVQRIRAENHTEPLRAQIWGRNRDPQWNQRRHGWQQRSNFEELRPVTWQI